MDFRFASVLFFWKFCKEHFYQLFLLISLDRLHTTCQYYCNLVRWVNQVPWNLPNQILVLGKVRHISYLFFVLLVKISIVNKLEKWSVIWSYTLSLYTFLSPMSMNILSTILCLFTKTIPQLCIARINLSAMSWKSQLNNSSAYV